MYLGAALTVSPVRALPWQGEASGATGAHVRPFNLHKAADTPSCMYASTFGLRPPRRLIELQS
jgi:hypothetical protein